MDTRQTVDGWLQAIGAAHGIDGFKLNASGLFSGTFSQSVEFTLEALADQPCIYLYARLLKGYQASDAVMAKALDLNFFALGARETWIARDANAGDLCLCSMLEVASADARSFENWLGNLLSLSETTVQTLTAVIASQPTAIVQPTQRKAAASLTDELNARIFDPNRFA